MINQAKFNNSMKQFCNMTTKLNCTHSIFLVILLFSSLFIACQFNETTEKKDGTNATVDSITVLRQKIDSSLIAKMNDKHIPGVAVVIVQNGKTIYKQG